VHLEMSSKEILQYTKRKVAFTITRNFVGRLISYIYKDSIPSKHGLSIDTSNHRIDSQTKASIFWGIYEGAEMRFVERYLPKDNDVIELGGSVGVISSLIRKKTNAQTRLFIVEADDELIPSIEKNVRTNNPGKEFRVIHGAISYSESDEKGNTLFYASDKNTGGKKYSNNKSSSNKLLKSVPSVKLRDIITNNNIENFALVSDIEGAEAELLANDHKILDKCNFIIIELHNTELEQEPVKIKELLDKLLTMGYKLLDSDGAAVFVLSK